MPSFNAIFPLVVGEDYEEYYACRFSGTKSTFRCFHDTVCCFDYCVFSQCCPQRGLNPHSANAGFKKSVISLNINPLFFSPDIFDLFTCYFC